MSANRSEAITRTRQSTKIDESFEEFLAERAALKRELAELKSEAERTKLKYRAVQTKLAREKNKTEKLERRLEAARRDLEGARQRLGWRVHHAIEAWFRKLSRAVSLQRAERRKRRADLDLVRSSDLFDGSWYLHQYPDVAQSGIDPAEHFVSQGWREGRSPSAAFSVTRYLKKHADVFAMGVNPLVHYLEHGQFEAREIQPSGAVTAAPATLGPQKSAAPWISFGLAAEPPVIWSRACTLAPDDPRAFLVDGLVIGLESPACSRSAFEAALADLRALSGMVKEVHSSPSIRIPGAPDLADGWFAASNRLSTRWQTGETIVIRAVQCDSGSGGRPLIVGEGLCTGPLDVIDFDLAHPMFPLLFVATTPNGDVIGTTAMAFPSLLRGGAHYAELVDLASSHSLPSVSVAEQLEHNLRAIRRGDAEPLIKTLSVDLRSADGTGPLFQSSVCIWLAQVMGLTIRSSGSAADENATAYLAEFISNDPAHPRRSGGTLKLAADMLPAIGVLVEHARKDTASRECVMAVIVSEQDWSQPSTRFDPAATKAFWGNIESCSYPAAFPRMKGRDARPVLAAIRVLPGPLTESELLRPDSALQIGDRCPANEVTWIIPVENADAETTRDTLAALALQDGADLFWVSLTGSGAEALLPTAKRLFGERVMITESFEPRIDSIDTPLVGYLGKGVVLHDAQTFQLLNFLLKDESIASASCVLISAEQRGKGWHVSPVDVGVIPIDRTVIHGGAAAHVSLMLWRSTFPVIEPPRQLWLARRESVFRWQTGEPASKEGHLVTTLVSASASKQPEEDEPVLAPCPTGQTCAIRAKVLVG